MDGLVEVLIPVDAEAAKALDEPERKQAIGRLVSQLLKEDGMLAALVQAIAEAKRDARAAGLTDADIDAELEAWRAERTH